MPFPDLPQTEAAIVQMTNAFRAENRLDLVTVNPVLAKAAKAYAEYLAKTGKFAHEADGRQPSDRTLAAGYKHCVVAENLALNQSSRGYETRQLAAQAVDGWKKSQPHREAMLLPHVTEIGVGIAMASDKDPRFLSVQLFGRPESLKLTFKVENHAERPIHYGFATKRHEVPANAWVVHSACTPGSIVVEGVSSAFKAADGAVFRVSRDAAGPLRVEMSVSASATVKLPR